MFGKTMPVGLTVGTILHLNSRRRRNEGKDDGDGNGFETRVVVERVDGDLKDRSGNGNRCWLRRFEGTNEYGTKVSGEYRVQLPLNTTGENRGVQKGTFTTSYKLNSYPWELHLMHIS